MARYGKAFKDKALSRLLPPESADVREVALQLGVSASTLDRWRSEALLQPSRERIWTAAAKFDALLVTASMDEATKGAWCRENGVYLKQLQSWREDATLGLDSSQGLAQTKPAARDARKRIKELERELHRKEKALAETAALLVLSKKVEAILKEGGDE